ncbi:stress response protein Bis1 [Pseudozyma hubeiensis SY62]|uniref:Stress response protein Bis1 n=1 Tax=Pseudozyma hubeiensis (strain SY62) TaxID=1305764 RepID=R9PDZ0_PSEHS|nr:stress response protein Bis1 [Pseudozyma hubeiensis SY62]GAC99457.1 stress response protein Bis1 [Pseudozyma hubeiensis SY62]
MPLRKEPPTPRSAAVDARLDSSNHAGPSRLGLAPLIPFKPGQTSLRKQTILTEDEYTSALSSIIKRDFFPGLDRITAENEYLAAVEAEDPTRIRVALNRLLTLDKGTEASPAPERDSKQRRRDATHTTSSRRRERGEWDDTPLASGSSRVFDPTFTPAGSTPGLSDVGEAGREDDVESASGIDPDLGISLAGFQARYTSEDNASFSQLLDRDNQLRKRKHAHLFAREQASEQRRKQIIASEQLAAAKGKQLAIESNPDHPKLLEEAKEQLLIGGSKDDSPQSLGATGQEMLETKGSTDPMDDLILVPEPRRDDRPTSTGLNRWKYTARNALMFPPDANESYLHARPSASTFSTEITPAAAPETNFSALRLPEQSDALTTADRPESEAGWSPSSSRVDAAIQRGRAGSFTSSIASSSVDETPKVSGYGFVTPYSTPQHAVADEMHLRIYNAIKGKRDATQASTGVEGFQLPRLDKREQLAQKLTSTPKKANAGTTPYGQAR